jgi:hypothetical protein
MKIRDDIEVGALRQVAVGTKGTGRNQKELYQKGYSSPPWLSHSHLLLPNRYSRDAECLCRRLSSITTLGRDQDSKLGWKMEFSGGGWAEYGFGRPKRR